MKMIGLAAFCVLVISAVAVNAAATLSVSTIERAFNLYPGATIPLRLPNGGEVRVQYKRIESRGQGEYAVIVRVAN